MDRYLESGAATGLRHAETGGAGGRLDSDTERGNDRGQSVQRLARGGRVPCLLALDAEVELASAHGVRRLPLEDFIVGPRRTALNPGEIVTSVHVPRSALEGRSRFLKLGARRYLVISIAMVAVRLVVEDGRVGDAAVAVGACSAVATRLPQVEAALTGLAADHTLADAISEDVVCAVLSPLDDIRATAGYRGHAATELLRRAVTDAVGAEGGS